jgi:hypothetical protein
MNILKILIDCRHDMLEKNSTLDLHGLHVDEAIAALERILPSREFGKYTFTARIITLISNQFPFIFLRGKH